MHSTNSIELGASDELLSDRDLFRGDQLIGNENVEDIVECQEAGE